MAVAALAACASVPHHRAYAPGYGSYVLVRVQEGDTLSEIARRNHVTEDNIAAMNGLRNRDVLYTGQLLRVPAYGNVVRYQPIRDRLVLQQPQPRYQPVRQQPVHQPPAPKREVHTAPPARTQVALTVPIPIPRPRPAVSAGIVTASLPSPEPAHPSPLVQARFLWPLDGVVISNFGARMNGERNDGINISCTGGEEIRAVGDGTVTYAGNELKGYGNLVLIKHTDGFTSAYAHVDHIVVNRGDRVEKGQIIATAGATGDVAEPQLHFELRHGVTPVDPRPYLQAYGL